jgi:hypothetical protein
MRWLLVPMPFALCATILWITSFLRIGWLHLMLLGPISLGVPIAVALAIAPVFINGHWRWVLVAAYVIPLYFLWSHIIITYGLNPFP